MSGELVYFEIPAADAERARAFYGELFGWHFEESNFDPGYFMIPDATPMGGLSGGEESSSPWVYFGVEEIGAGVALVRELGGEADEPREIPSGYFARCRDAQGIPFGLWQTKEDGR